MTTNLSPRSADANTGCLSLLLIPLIVVGTPIATILACYLLFAAFVVVVAGLGMAGGLVIYLFSLGPIGVAAPCLAGACIGIRCLQAQALYEFSNKLALIALGMAPQFIFVIAFNSAIRDGIEPANYSSIATLYEDLVLFIDDAFGKLGNPLVSLFILFAAACLWMFYGSARLIRALPAYRKRIAAGSALALGLSSFTLVGALPAAAWTPDLNARLVSQQQLEKKEVAHAKLGLLMVERVKKSNSIATAIRDACIDKTVSPPTFMDECRQSGGDYVKDALHSYVDNTANSDDTAGEALLPAWNVQKPPGSGATISQVRAAAAAAHDAADAASSAREQFISIVSDQLKALAADVGLAWLPGDLARDLVSDIWDWTLGPVVNRLSDRALDAIGKSRTVSETFSALDPEQQRALERFFSGRIDDAVAPSTRVSMAQAQRDKRDAAEAAAARAAEQARIERVQREAHSPVE